MRNPRLLIIISLIGGHAANSYSQGIFQTSGFGTGHLNFSNIEGAAGINARVTFQDGSPVGPPYNAALYIGPPGSAASSLAAVFVTSFWRTGAAAGYWVRADVDFPLPDPSLWVTLQARVFEGATWESSLCRGESNLIEAFMNSGPTGLPEDMVGLQPFQVICIPEPSAAALLFLGCGLLWRWKVAKEDEGGEKASNRSAKVSKEQ